MERNGVYVKGIGKMLSRERERERQTSKRDSEESE